MHAIFHCMYLPQLYHSSISGHLGCFHVLAIVNSAALNIEVHVSFQIRVFSRYLPRSGIAGSYDTSIYSFLRISILFSTVAAPVSIPILVLLLMSFSVLVKFHDLCPLSPHLSLRTPVRAVSGLSEKLSESTRRRCLHCGYLPGSACSLG